MQPRRQHAHGLPGLQRREHALGVPVRPHDDLRGPSPPEVRHAAAPLLRGERGSRGRSARRRRRPGAPTRARSATAARKHGGALPAPEARDHPAPRRSGPLRRAPRPWPRRAECSASAGSRRPATVTRSTRRGAAVALGADVARLAVRVGVERHRRARGRAAAVVAEHLSAVARRAADARQRRGGFVVRIRRRANAVRRVAWSITPPTAGSAARAARRWAAPTTRRRRVQRPQAISTTARRRRRRGKATDSPTPRSTPEADEGVLAQRRTSTAHGSPVRSVARDPLRAYPAAAVTARAQWQCASEGRPRPRSRSPERRRRAEGATGRSITPPPRQGPTSRRAPGRRRRRCRGPRRRAEPPERGRFPPRDQDSARSQLDPRLTCACDTPIFSAKSTWVSPRLRSSRNLFWIAIRAWIHDEYTPVKHPSPAPSGDSWYTGRRPSRRLARALETTVDDRAGTAATRRPTTARRLSARRRRRRPLRRRC